jgi:TIR domain
MVKVFFSYSHKDELLRDTLETHLAALKRRSLIETWHDRRIVAGDPFDPTIRKELETADIILFLVSPDFLASDYCANIEMTRAMERSENKEARVIPVILRPCDWRDEPFGKLLVTPTDGKPLTKFPNQDDAFLEVVNAIKQAIKSLSPIQSSLPLVSHGLPTQSGNIFKQSTTVNNPRSSNLRIRREFSDRDRDKFREDSFEFIANFFENSLTELSKRQPDVENNFRRIDANHFSCIIYIGGKAKSQCRTWIGGHHHFPGDILYSANASSSDNSMNDYLSVVSNEYNLFLRPAALSSFGSQDKQSLLTPQGGAEYLWGLLIERLQ